MKAYKLKLSNGKDSVLVKDDKSIRLMSENYNFMFNKADGFFARWGKTQEDDGDLEIGLPEIADIEIAEVCEGVPGIGPCSFCYKSNTGFKGDNMSLDTFKNIFDKLPPTVTQIAFGCGTLRRHPEMWDIFNYSKENGVTPNLTINGDVDDHEFDKIGGGDIDETSTTGSVGPAGDMTPVFGMKKESATSVPATILTASSKTVITTKNSVKAVKSGMRRVIVEASRKDGSIIR